MSEPTTVIERDICPSCDGLGHVPTCKCDDPVDFIMGCCARCCGEGFVTLKPARKVIVITDNEQECRPRWRTGGEG